MWLAKYHPACNDKELMAKCHEGNCKALCNMSVQSTSDKWEALQAGFFVHLDLLISQMRALAIR